MISGIEKLQSQIFYKLFWFSPNLKDLKMCVVVVIFICNIWKLNSNTIYKNKD